MTQQLGKRLDWESVNKLAQLTGGPDLFLKDTQLHLWSTPLILNAEQETQALTLLNDRQREKYDRRREPSQQSAYLAGRYYLFSLLNLYTQLPIDQIELGYNRLNKPRLVNNPIDLQFNYTDTRLSKDTSESMNLGLFAFCINAAVGVDIEARKRTAGFDQIAAKRFTQAELNYVKNITADEALKNGAEVDPERCLAIWTRKEAYGKAIGKGINFVMNEQNLASDGEPYELNFTDGANAPWRLNQIEIGEDLIACVVHAEHQPLSLKGFSLEPSALSL